MSLTGAVFLVGFFAGCLLAFIRHPIYGLMTYVAVFYLHPPSRWWGASMPDLRWSLVASVVTLIALLMRSRKVKNPMPLFQHKVMAGMIIFILWIGLQNFWALDPDQHMFLFSLVAKYGLLLLLIYRCVDSEENLRLFLWTHVLGCFYLGWIVFTTYKGGRFEGFGGPGIDEANTGALQIVTGIFVGSALFLYETWRNRVVLLACMPFIVNAVVATISRSAFLAAAFGGLVFNLFTPKRFRMRVRVLSILAIVLFMMLTNPGYWMRILSIQYAGEEVEGVDTGSGRIVLMHAQERMFMEYPFGCGHRCTVILSPRFLDAAFLSNGGRASHNTVMTMLVEHGIPGILIYSLLFIWMWKNLLKLARECKGKEGLLPSMVPAIAASLAAITLGDLFVDYVKFEARFWFVATLMVMLNLSARRNHLPATVPAEDPKPAPAKPGVAAPAATAALLPAAGGSGSRAGLPSNRTRPTAERR